MNFSEVKVFEAHQSWKPTEPDFVNHIYERRVSPDGGKFIGIKETPTGYNIQAGNNTGIPSIELDWDCGNEQAMVILTYHMALTCLYIGMSFDMFPTHNKNKPWYDDEVFTEELMKTIDSYV